MSTPPSSSSSVVTETVVSFLKNIPPVQFLPAWELATLAPAMALEYFPKGSVILRAGYSAAESLYLVQKGAVKLGLRSGVGKELVLDMRSEGELFGLLSMMGRDVTRLDVSAVEDTICYTIPAARVQHLISTYTEFADYLLRTSITRYMDRSLAELRERTRLLGDGERLLYTLTAGVVAQEPPTVCAPTTTLREAARLLSTSGATALVVAGDEGRAAGIVTDRDFSGKVVAHDLAGDLPVAGIMSSPVISIESGAPAFEALLAMLRRNIHHLLVTHEGLPKAVLSDHDLLLLQGKSPLSVARHIDQQTSVEGLAAARKRAAELLPLLMREGARASHITRVLASINDRLTAKILELAEARLGAPPAPYCWVATGSEGRAEQTFQTDQDNALIYADAAAGDAAAEAYFARLAEFVRDALVACGYPLCTGGYMAANPEWRLPLKSWQERFRVWISEARRRSVEDALIFFDMRPVAGDASLYGALAAHNRQLAAEGGLFRSVLAFISTENKPPLGFFRTLVLERSGDHKNELDLKLCGTAPIVNAARLFALSYGIEAVNTIDRLSALSNVAVVEPELLRELGEAFEFLLLLRLELQLGQARAGQALGNHVRPASLTHLQRNLLREAFHTIARIQSVIDSQYRSAIWSQLGR